MRIGSGRSTIILVHDVAMVAAATAGCGWLVQNLGARVGDELSGPRVAILVGLSIAGFLLFGVHKRVWSYTAVSDIQAIGATAAVILAAWLAGLGLTAAGEPPAAIPVVLWLLTVALLTGSRLLYRQIKLISAARRQGLNSLAGAPVLIYGAEPIVPAFLTAVEETRRSGFRIVGLVDDTGERRGRYFRDIPYLGGISDLEDILLDLAASGVLPHKVMVLSDTLELGDEARLAIERAREVYDFEVAYTPFLPGLAEPGAIRVGTLSPGVARRGPTPKRLLDVVLSAALLTITAPLILLVSLAVLIDLGQPILFRQVRPGHSLEPFQLYKFRTMRPPRPGGLGPESDRHRISAIGHFLRRTRLDELPQLWNVLRGDMSLIGPRPLLPRDLPTGCRARYDVRPGITGWAQVNGGHKLTAEEKAALDLWYIRHRSLALDLKTLLMTLRTAIWGERIGYRAIQQALLAADPQLEHAPDAADRAQPAIGRAA